MKILQHLLDMRKLVWPEVCIACHRDAPIRNESFCLECYLQLSYTDHFEVEQNAFVKHFWGRLIIDHGASLLHFRKSDRLVREMVHGLKYLRRSYIGYRLGLIAGKKYQSSSLFSPPDLIVPVPIHWRKKMKRGYNQALHFGIGISEILEVPCKENILTKPHATGSQTKRTRSERIENVAHSFRLKKKHHLENKHVLLVDDVITTGATLESCGWLLEDIPGIKISMMTIAIARG